MKECFALAFLVCACIGTLCVAGEGRDPVEELLQKAGAALEKDAFAEAAATSREILAKNPEHATALSLLGSALLGLGENEDARKVLEKGMAMDPASAIPYLYLGESWVRDDTKKAKFYWDKMLSIEPDMPIYYSRVGWILSYFGDYDGAMEFLNRGLERFPENRSIQLARAYIYQRARHFDKVTEIFAELLRQNPRDAEVIARSVILYALFRDTGEAERGLELLRALNDEPKFLNYAEGFYYLVTEDKAKSLAAYLKAARYEQTVSDRYQITRNIGNLFLEKEQYEDAVHYLELSIRLLDKFPGLDAKPARANVSSHLGLTLFRLGRLDEAEEYLIYSTGSGYGLSLDFRRLSDILVDKGQPGKALEVLKNGMAKYPLDAVLPILSAIILVDQGEASSAKSILERIVTSPPDETGADQNDIKKAKSLLEELD